MADQGGFNVKVTAQDLASTVIEGVGRSVGTIATEVVLAKQKIGELKALIQDNADKPGFLAGLSAELDQELPKLKALEDELRQAGKTGQEAFAGANESTTNWAGGLSEVRSILAAFGIATTLSGIVQFGEGIVENARKIEQLHEATGIAAVDLQRLEYVGQGVGLSMDQMGRAVETLSTRLAKGDASAVGAVQALGLSVDDLKRTDPLEVFLRAAEGAGRIEDPLQRAGIASELFGDRLGKKLLPMLSDLRTELSKVPDKALIPDDDIKAIDELARGWQHAKTELEAYLAKSVMGFFKPTPEQLASFTKPGPVPTAPAFVGPQRPGAFVPGAMVGQAAQPAIGSPDTISNIDLLNNRLKALRAEAMDPLTESQKRSILELKEWGEGEKTIAELVGSNIVAVHLYIEAHKKAEEELKKHNAEADRLAKVTADATSSMNTLTGAQIEAIKYYEAEGVSVSEIAKVLEIYEHQVHQVETAEKELAKARKEELDVRSGITLAPDGRVASYIAGLKEELTAFKQNQTVEEGMRQQHDTYVRSLTMSFFDFQRSKIDEWQNIEEGKLNYSVDGWQKAYALIGAVAKDKYQQIAADERLALAEMHAQELNWSNEFRVLLDTVPKALQAAFTGGGGLKGALDASLSAVGGDIGGKLFAAGGPLNAVGGQFARKMGDMFGSGLGDAIGLALPGIGQALGSLIGPLLSKLFSIGGPSKEELAGRSAEGNFEASMASKLTAQERLAVGTDHLRQAEAGLQNQYIASGMSADQASQQAQADFKALLDAEKEGGDAVQRVQDQITARMDAQSAAQELATSGIDALAKAANDTGATMPADFQASIDKLITMGGVTDEEKAKLLDLKNAGIAVGTGVDALASAVQAAGTAMPNDFAGTIDQLLSMNGLTDAERTKLEALKTAGQIDYKTLEQEAKSYGVSLDALGPKFNQDKLNDEAGKLGQFFQDAKKEGANLGGVLAGIRDETQGFVSDALKNNLTLPTSLKEVAQYFFDTGQLTDQTGKKLTDFSKLSFAETPIEKSTDAIVQAINDLKDALLKLPGAAATAASGMNDALSKVNSSIPQPHFAGDGSQPDRSSMTGDGTGGDQPVGYDSGTPGLGFVDFGKGTLAVLHGHEAVIPKDAVPDFLSKNFAQLTPPGGNTSTPYDNPYAHDFDWWNAGGNAQIPQPTRDPNWSPIPTPTPGPVPDSPKTVEMSADVKQLADLIRQLLEMVKQGQAPTPVTIQTLLDSRVIAESTVKLAQKNSYGIGDQIRWVAQQGMP